MCIFQCICRNVRPLRRFLCANARQRSKRIYILFQITGACLVKCVASGKNTAFQVRWALLAADQTIWVIFLCRRMQNVRILIKLAFFLFFASVWMWHIFVWLNPFVKSFIVKQIATSLSIKMSCLMASCFKQPDNHNQSLLPICPVANVSLFVRKKEQFNI